MMTEKNKVVQLGTFDLSMPRLQVSDPCYEPGQGPVLKARPGQWGASAVLFDEGGGDRRVGSLTVWHTHVFPLGLGPNTEFDLEEPNGVGVDSGQAGFFDAALYDEVPNDLYDYICGLTGSNPYGGIVESNGHPFGAVSSTGFGDGVYTLEYRQNPVGEVIAARITFIQDERDDV